MKQAGEILRDLIADMIANNEDVTYFGNEGVLRGIFHAIAYTAADIWNDLYQTKRNIFVDTAEGDNLDLLGERRGISRRSASKSSLPVVINGPEDTVIPAGTVIKSALSNVRYQTLSELTLGQRNPDLLRPVWEITLGDVVMCESIESGKSTRVKVNELTVFETPIADVTCNNLVPSTGGDDEEDDTYYRQRIKDYLSLLNHGTQLYYETVAKEVEETVLLTKAVYDPATGGTKIYLVKNSLADYSSAELTSIASSIYDEQRACLPVTCVNASRKAIEIAFTYERGDVSAAEVYKTIAQAISDYTADNFGFNATIEFQEILNLIIDTDGVKRLSLQSLLINNAQADVTTGDFEVPVFVYLSANDGTEIETTIEQRYIPA